MRLGGTVAPGTGADTVPRTMQEYQNELTEPDVVNEIECKADGCDFHEQFTSQERCMARMDTVYPCCPSCGGRMKCTSAVSRHELNTNDYAGMSLADIRQERGW